MVPSGSKQTGFYWAPEWGIPWLLHLRWQMAQRHQDLVLSSSSAWDKLRPAAQLVASSEQQENSYPPLPGTGLFCRCCAEGYWQVLHGYFMCLISPSSEVEVAQLCLILCDPMHYTVHGILQLNHKGSPRILEWVAYPFFSWSSWPKNRTRVSCIAGGFLTNPVAQLVKSLPAMQETWVQSLGWEDSLEKEMATHSSILAWRIPRIEDPGGLQSMGDKESDTTEWLTHAHN